LWQRGLWRTFQLSKSGEGWTESVLYAFSEGKARDFPVSGVTFDSAGNLYGTLSSGGAHGQGSVYELTPSASGWTQTTLHSFGQGEDGGDPFASLTVDQQGNLYGTTSDNGSVYELRRSGGNWSYRVLQGVPLGPYDAPTFDAFIISMRRRQVRAPISATFSSWPRGAGGWTYTDLYDFFSSGNFNDGFFPLGGVVLDSNGNLYGTSFEGGSMNPPCGEGCGVVWEITP
jgi:uncharacterized repeat protein (TIGR03803 family)